MHVAVFGLGNCDSLSPVSTARAVACAVAGAMQFRHKNWYSYWWRKKALVLQLIRSHL